MFFDSIEVMDKPASTFWWPWSLMFEQSVELEHREVFFGLLRGSFSIGSSKMGFWCFSGCPVLIGSSKTRFWGSSGYPVLSCCPAVQLSWFTVSCKSGFWGSFCCPVGTFLSLSEVEQLSLAFWQKLNAARVRCLFCPSKSFCSRAARSLRFWEPDLWEYI